MVLDMVRKIAQLKAKLQLIHLMSLLIQLLQNSL
jgi:hypothetical protein